MQTLRRYEVSTDGTTITTFSYTNAAKGEDGYATINFTITGSFVDTPNVRAACEGNWISRTVTCNAPTNNGRTVTGSVEVKPTTAYVGDERKGKLSLYVPYYGATGIGQIDLTAAGSTNIGLSGTDRGMQILEKSAEETEATVTFSLDEGGSAPSSSGPCKLAFDFDYTLTNEITENGVRVETGNGFSNTYKANGWLGAGACTYDASTKTYTQKIDLTYNTDTEKSRTAAVIVYSPSGREVTRFVIEQDKLTPQNPDVPVIDNIPITKLVPSGKDAANCYIITGPGRYELPAYKGAYKANQLTDDKKCEGRPIVVWNDNSGNTIEFFQKDLADNKILIDINPTKTNGNVTGHSGAVSNGNAVVAVKGDDGKILWSWHLWFCATDADPRNPGHQYPKGADNISHSFLDRSLGATPGTIDAPTNGLYYQYGRKDPLRLNGDGNAASSINDNTASHNNSVEAPQDFFTGWSSSMGGWSSSKSINDPCPPGYKVPASTAWKTENDDHNKILQTNESRYIYNYYSQNDGAEDNIAYGYSGHISSTGSLDSGVDHYFESEATGLEVQGGILTPKLFRNIRFKFKRLITHGAQWANDQNTMTYGFENVNGAANAIEDFFTTIDVVSCEYCTGENKSEWVQTGKWPWQGEWVEKFVWTYNWITLDEEGFKALGTTEAYQVSSKLKEYMKNQNVKSIGYEYKINSTDFAANNGLQVRCVKE